MKSNVPCFHRVIGAEPCSECAYVYAEGRKAAENYTEKMLVFAKDEVRKCHEEIRRLEEKYACNVYKMPPYNPSFDENEHAKLVKKGTKARAGHKEEKCHTEEDFQELLRMASKLRGFDEVLDAWKKARGLE